MEGTTKIRTGDKDVISSGSVIPFESDEITELFFDYADFKLRITLEFKDSTAKKDKGRHYYTPLWHFSEKDGDPNILEPNTLELKFVNTAVGMAPGGPTKPIKLGTFEGKTLYLRIRVFGNSSDRIVIYYTLYSVQGGADE